MKKRNLHKKTNHGFTLLELLLVVSIIAVLAAIAIPQFSTYRRKAYDSAAQADIKSFKTGLESYYFENKFFPY